MYKYNVIETIKLESPLVEYRFDFCTQLGAVINNEYSDRNDFGVSSFNFMIDLIFEQIFLRLWVESSLEIEREDGEHVALGFIKIKESTYYLKSVENMLYNESGFLSKVKDLSNERIVLNDFISYLFNYYLGESREHINPKKKIFLSLTNSTICDNWKISVEKDNLIGFFEHLKFEINNQDIDYRSAFNELEKLKSKIYRESPDYKLFSRKLRQTIINNLHMREDSSFD